MKGEPSLLSKAFVLAFLANFLHTMALHSYVHLPGFVDGLGGTETVIGTVMATATFTAIMVRPGIGWLMDRRGRRIVILLGGALNVLACLLYLRVESLGPLLYGVRIIHGVGRAAVFSAIFTLAADVVPPTRRAQGLALFGISGIMPLALGGILGDWITQGGEYGLLFWSTAGYAVLGVLVSLPLPETKPQAVPGEEAGKGFWGVVVSKPMLPIWLLASLFAASLASYFAFIKTYILELGVGTVGLFFTSYALAVIAVRVFTGRLPERLGPHRVLIPGTFMSVIGLGVLALGGTAPLIGLAGVLTGMGHGYAFPILSAMVVDRASSADRGVAVSIFTALFDFGLFIGAPSLGLLVDLTSYPTMFLVAAGVLAGALVVFTVWEWPRLRRPKSP